MRIALKTLALSSAALCATAAFAASQARVIVPFSFTAKGHVYPAGPYKVTLDLNHNMVNLASQMEPAKQMTWTVGPADAASQPVILKFDQMASEYALSRIQVGLRVTGNLDSHPKHSVSATTSIGGQ